MLIPIPLRIRRIVSYGVLFILLFGCIFAFADDTGDDPLPDPSQVSIEVLRISAQDTSGFHAVILGLLGDYNPIVKDYTYQTTSYNGSLTTNHSIDIQPDWSWIMSAAIFIVIVFSLFRLVGGLFSCKR